MGSKAWTMRALAIAMLMATAIFTWDSVWRGLWINVSVGVAASAILVMLILTTWRAVPLLRAEPPLSSPADPNGLHLLLDQVPIPLVSYSEKLGAHAVNRAARSLFQTDGSIVSGAQDLIRAMTGRPGGRPIMRILGHQYAVNVSEVLAGDRPLRLASLTDVQMEMHKAEAAALRDTLHILSHEIMNSLTPVASLADIADSYLVDVTHPSVPPAREALETLSRRAGSLTRFIEAYRSIARLPEPVLQPVDPLLLINDIVSLLALDPKSRNVDLQVEGDSGLPRLNLDEAQMSQAIINVITNAIEATEENEAARRVHIAVSASSLTLEIRISDNGPGISEMIAANLFTAFATTKPKGSGTGLNLARQIVLAHGGNLSLLDDGRGGETVFAFILPLPL